MINFSSIFNANTAGGLFIYDQSNYWISPNQMLFKKSNRLDEKEKKISCLLFRSVALVLGFEAADNMFDSVTQYLLKVLFPFEPLH